MVHLMYWSEFRLAGLRWSTYVDVCRGQTPNWWRYGGPRSNLMRFPDQLVFQS
jgi:hypothetical protein